MPKSKKEKLPRLPAGTPGHPKNSRFVPQFGVIVICPDEKTQRSVYEGLRVMGGCKLRVVNT